MLSEHRLSLLYFRKINVRFLREKKIDLIHSQTPGSIGLLGIILAKQSGIPHLHHYQTYFEDYAHYLMLPSVLMRFSIKKLSKWFCNRMDLITVPTYPFKSLLESYGIKKEIRLWTSGINTRRFRYGQNIRNELGIDQGKILLLFVGRVAKEKNIEFLLELMPDLVKKDPRFHLLVVGDGPQREELIQYAKSLGVKRHVSFVGYIPRERMADIYHSADLFVFSSLTETQGLVVLEAMAASLPVVAVPAFGIKYVLQDGEGAFLSELNKHEFIDKILRMLRKDVYGKMRKKALRYVARFSCERSTADIIRIYKDLIRRKRV
jgi:glycosyltransferase involved in cell wall biosynthesis